MDLKRSKRERDQIRRVIHRHEPATCTLADYEFIKEKFGRLEILDKNIQDYMLNEDDFKQKEYEEECEEADNYKKLFIELTQRVYQNRSQQNRHNLNLPKLELRKFNDNPKEWLGFWGQFKKIDEDPSLDAETKFQYLRQAVVPGSKAESLVHSYPPTEQNYPKVIAQLKQRFAKEDILIEIYVRELLKLVTHKGNISLDVLYRLLATRT